MVSKVSFVLGLLLLGVSCSRASENDKISISPGAGAVASESGDRSSCKRGGAYGYHSEADLSAFSEGAAWWYNWAAKPDEAVASSFQNFGMEFVPMVWGGTFDVDQVISQIPDGAKYLLGFNEPNFKSQANLSPSEAAALWPKIEEIAKAKNLKIVSPAVNYCGPSTDCHETNPYTYLDKFFAACADCQIDYIAVHWYACSGDALKNYLQGFAKYGKPLWVTEFSCGDGTEAQKTAAAQKTYMQEALAILEADSKVFRYSWFASRTTAISGVDLFANSGQLTTLGSAYLEAASQVNQACAKE